MLVFFAMYKSVYYYAAVVLYHFSLSLSGWIIMKNQVFDSVYSTWLEGRFPSFSHISAYKLTRLKKNSTSTKQQSYWQKLPSVLMKKSPQVGIYSDLDFRMGLDSDCPLMGRQASCEVMASDSGPRTG